MKRRLVVDARKAFDAGIGTYIHETVPRVLQRLDVETVVLVPHGQADRHNYLGDAHGAVQEIDAAPLTIAEQWELRRRIGPQDLFWATSLAHPMLSAGEVVATVHDVAQIAAPQDVAAVALTRAAARLMFDHLRRRALALIAISEFTRDEFVRCVGRPVRGEISAVHLGVTEEWFRPHEGPSARSGRAAPYFICVGSVRPHKNVERLVRSFAMVAPSVPHDLLVVGLPPADGVHQAWRAEIPEAQRDRVRFTGHVTDTDLRALVAGADALVFPSLYEGFGLPALEAMAAGCPVLISHCSALLEVCGDAAADTFDARSTDQMAAALRRHAARSATEREVIVERGRARAARFSWESTATQTAALLEACLRSSGGAR
jgi:glycosyltransferase involved in cell wall biosynthesis